MLTIGIVAGEVSGDRLGADFITSVQAIVRNVRFVGVGGTAMQRAGLVSVLDINRLSVMGIGEIVRHLPDLVRAKYEILAEFDKSNIDIFVGIDAPDFNLRLGKALKPKGVFCVQYVSPSVWAWRENRIHNIKQATQLVLCLFPFELPVYIKHHHPAVCVGHPLIKNLMPIARQSAIEVLLDFGVPSDIFDKQVLCLMAGSRISELNKLLPILLASLDELTKDNNVFAIIPVAKTEQVPLVQTLIHQVVPHLFASIYIVSPQDERNPAYPAMGACDLALLGSGTATLEALLLHAPMVVVYRVKAVTYEIAKRLITTPYVALPNILSYHQNNTVIVPELIQYHANPSLIKAYATLILSEPDTQKNALANLADSLKKHATQDPAKVVMSHYDKFKKTVIGWAL